MRVYASISEFLYFNKIVQIPLLAINNLEKIEFRELFEHFYNCSNDFAIMNNINQNFHQHADQISKGKSEFLYKEGFLDIYWPPGEFEYIKLVSEKKLHKFYDEFQNCFEVFCKSNKSKKIFLESVELNKKMMRLPWTQKDEILEMDYEIIDSYRDILKLNKPLFLKNKNTIKIIKNDMKFENIQDWMREVIWYGHRSGKYLCNVDKIESKKNKEIEKNIDKSLDEKYIGRNFGPYMV